VREAAVVSMPHERLGEGICAYVIAIEQADAATLAEYVLESGLARQKCPEHFEFVNDLPRTASGKVRKDLLREDIRNKLS
jgi:acyl-CoA synthetase